MDERKPFVIIAGIAGEAESLAMLERARLILGHPVVNVILGEHLDPTSFDTADRLQVFTFEAPEPMPVPQLTRERKDRPPHERIAAQRGHKCIPRRR
jgi:hypothetical protein